MIVSPVSPPPLLRVRGLTKKFVLHEVDGRVVPGLQGMDLTINDREHVALAGSSGAGKSSLLKCIHRTYIADEGTIDFRTGEGHVVDLCQLSDPLVARLRAREIGYVSQFLRAEPRRGVLEVVTRAATRMGLDRSAAGDAAAEILRRVNIGENLWGTYPTLLSGGEKQRVNLAAGIVVPPRLVLLDEPVSALDPANRAAVLDVIAELTDRDSTVLSVFHDLDAMARLADRIVMLERGRAVREGRPSEILNQTIGVS